MKALVKKYAKKGLWFEDVPLPEVGINDALIKIKRTAICGTDMHIYNWDEWAEKTVPVPLIIGHEFVGEIVKIGSNVHDFSVGQIVSGEGHLVCGRCRNCLAGRRHLCIDCKGIGVNHPGAFAEYIAIPVANIIDFIRTHHGTTRVEYFYRSYLKEHPEEEVDESQFRYPGPNPRTKEETIMMMADSIEAACKSLKNPSEKDINDLIDKIINGKVSMGQFVDSRMTFQELEVCKETFKQVMKSVHHVRIEYPEEKKALPEGGEK